MSLLKDLLRLVGGKETDAIVLHEIQRQIEESYKHDGKSYVAMTRVQLSQNIGMSVTKIERSLARLRYKKLISSEQHIVGSRNVNHYRLTEDAWEIVLRGYAE